MGHLLRPGRAAEPFELFGVSHEPEVVPIAIGNHRACDVCIDSVKLDDPRIGLHSEKIGPHLFSVLCSLFSR